MFSRSLIIGIPGCQVEPVQQEEIGRPRIPPAAMHAPDQAHFLGVHVGLRRVDEIITDVDVDHPADFERRARSE